MPATDFTTQPPAGNKQSNTGMRLTTIVDRGHSLHGNIDISSAPNQGTSIYIELDIKTAKYSIT